MDPEDVYDTFINAHIPFADFSRHPPASQAYLECVIVEPRPHRRLLAVLSTISAHLPNAAITILHSKAHPLPTKLQNAKNIKKIPVCDENLTRPQYSELLTSPRLWDEILEAPYSLVFQTDTGIRVNNILRFLEYDYVGAPWSWMVAGSHHIQVGNGGFSLRNRKVMSAIVNKYIPDPHWKDPVTNEEGEAEDIFFARNLVHWETAILPSYEVASSFSVEHNMHENPMGFHRAYCFHDISVVRRWLAPPVGNPPSLLPESPKDHGKVEDVWVQTVKGAVYTAPHFKAWLSLGISGIDDTLRIPKDTRIPLSAWQVPAQDIGVPKILCFKISGSPQHNGKVYKVPLYQQRVKDFVELCLTN
jgi:hypothetical protein